MRGEEEGSGKGINISSYSLETAQMPSYILASIAEIPP